MHSGKLSGIFKRICRAIVAVAGLAAAGAGTAAESDAVPSDSVYVVEARSAGGAIKRGSAVAIGHDMLLTNCHVTRAATHIQVGRDGYTWPAQVRTGNGELDLCILTAPMGGGRAARFRDAASLGVGEQVYAAGYPVGQAISIRAGSVRALHRHENSNVIQVSAPFDFGASGGGLFDRYGNLVGVLTFKMLGGDDYYFAVPTEWISRVLAEAARRDDAPAFWERSPAALPPFLSKISLESAGRRNSGTSGAAAIQGR
jgi:S1-C subfamily serine protease